ncbi:uncharacterized protein LOC112571532 isoform X2 [Pomacea canaliculata]|uniref:uncharacterized protein LOC112571532 isoform X2 n=1 Tax=Pomacea canaliculata TaxID=400727 RepID=UPI000D727B05|nr:uncharacterized protein LOC112571532 isoform X2 [Pomacea canaliculata]
MANNIRVLIASGDGANLEKRVKVTLPHINVLNLQYDATGITKEMIEYIENAEILLCDPPFFVECLSLKIPHKFKWVQVTWAGIDSLRNVIHSNKLELGCCLTRTGEGFGQLMGEYVLGHIISREHHFQELLLKQKQKEWSRAEFSNIRPLTSLTIGILGLGSIGSEVARMCKEMGMTVWALSRTKKMSAPYVDYLRTYEDLKELLSNSDYICNILPDTAETHNLLSGDVLKECQMKKSVLINIGRGTIISEESLVHAISEGWLGGAVLDVFVKEPLPSNSVLWSLDGVLITPHVSGPFSTKVADAFISNFRLYEAKKPLKYVVDWEKGY